MATYIYLYWVNLFRSLIRFRFHSSLTLFSTVSGMTVTVGSRLSGQVLQPVSTSANVALATTASIELLNAMQTRLLQLS